MVRPQGGTHTPTPGRGELQVAMSPFGHDDVLLAEVWCNPRDTDDLCSGGISTVDGMTVRRVTVVDRLEFADQLRIEINRPKP